MKNNNVVSVEDLAAVIEKRHRLRQRANESHGNRTQVVLEKSDKIELRKKLTSVLKIEYYNIIGDR